MLEISIFKINKNPYQVDTTLLYLLFPLPPSPPARAASSLDEAIAAGGWDNETPP